MIFIILSLIDTGIPYKTAFHDKPAKSSFLIDYDHNFEVTREGLEYICYSKNTTDNDPIIGVEEGNKILIDDLNGSCSHWKRGLRQNFHLCHFLHLSTSNNTENGESNKFVIASMNETGLAFKNDSYWMIWNNSVIINYKCDPTIPSPGRLTEVKPTSQMNINIVFSTPKICNVKMENRAQTSTIHCFRKTSPISEEI